MINATGHFTTKIIRNYRLGYNVSVPYPKPGLAENNDIVELRAAPLIQYYSVFSFRPGLGYGTLVQCVVCTVCTGKLICLYPLFTILEKNYSFEKKY